MLNYIFLYSQQLISQKVKGNKNPRPHTARHLSVMLSVHFLSVHVLSFN